MPDLCFTLQCRFEWEARERKSGKNFHPWNNAARLTSRNITQNPYWNVIHGVESRDGSKKRAAWQKLFPSFVIIAKIFPSLFCVLCCWSITGELAENTWKLLLPTRDFLNYDYDYSNMTDECRWGGKMSFKENGKSFSLHNPLVEAVGLYEVNFSDFSWVQFKAKIFEKILNKFSFFFLCFTIFYAQFNWSLSQRGRKKTHIRFPKNSRRNFWAHRKTNLRNPINFTSVMQKKKYGEIYHRCRWYRNAWNCNMSFAHDYYANIFLGKSFRVSFTFSCLDLSQNVFSFFVVNEIKFVLFF